MKTHERSGQPAAEKAAELLLEVIPMGMRRIRAEVRKKHFPELSVPQFRTLMFLQRHRDASLSQLTEHIGLTLSSMSRLVDGLVSSGWVRRRLQEGNRRQLALSLTRRGEVTLRLVHRVARAQMMELLEVLSAEEQAMITAGLEILRGVLGRAPQEKGLSEARG